MFVIVKTSKNETDNPLDKISRTEAVIAQFGDKHQNELL